MDNKAEIKTSILSPPQGSAIKLVQSVENTTLTIPAKGFKGKGLLTISFIGLWLLTILIWSVLLLAMKPVNVLYSIPFWAIGIITLVKASNILRLEQSVIIYDEHISLKLKRGHKADELSFNKDEVSISLVEGSYYNYTGLSKRGIYPAILFHENAYSFGERLTNSEKKWLVDFLSYYTKNVS